MLESTQLEWQITIDFKDLDAETQNGASRRCPIRL